MTGVVEDEHVNLPNNEGVSYVSFRLLDLDIYHGLSFAYHIGSSIRRNRIENTAEEHVFHTESCYFTI